MQAYLPMLVVRTKNATAAVEMNGVLVGEAGGGAHLALPLSESGEYYIGIYPIKNQAHRYFPVVRKLKFLSGELQPIESEDVEAYAWPDSIYETVFTPGVLPKELTTVFPFTIDQAKLSDGCVATLYYENGLRLAIEEGMRVRYGTVLGEARKGGLLQQPNGRLIVLAGEASLPPGEVPEGYAGSLIALDQEYREIIRVEGDAVGMRGDDIVSYLRVPSQQKHEKKLVYRATQTGYEKQPEEIGFFTHSPEPPKTGRQMIHAFCEAVLYGLWDEAFSYLTPALRQGLDPETILSLFGDFTGVRTPLTRRDRAVGLLYPSVEGITPVRVFSWMFDEERIDNISEE